MVIFEGKLTSPALQEHAEKQLKKLVGDARVFLSKEGDNIKAQIVCGDLVATSQDRDGYKAITDASKTLIANQRKHKEIINDKKGRVSLSEAMRDDGEDVD